MGKWLPLTAVCLGAFMLLVDVNIVTVALPEMSTGLASSFSSLQWVMDIYALALAALLMGAGALADLVGRRKVYVTGLVVFALASLICGLAPDAVTLIVARAIQGAGAAMMFATTVALVNASYEGRDRAVAFGVWGAVNGAAAGVGPILGGLVTQQFGWRCIFLVNLPVCVVAVVLTLRVVAESRSSVARRIDVPGVVSFAVVVAAVTTALTKAGEVGWTATTTVGMLTAGAAALLVFVIVEIRSQHPILDLRLFRDPTFAGVMIASLVMSGTAFAYLLYTSLWLQTVQGLSAIGAGLVILPISGLAFVASWLTGRFLQGFSPRSTIGVGLLLVGVGTLSQAVLAAGSGWVALIPGFAITGVGVGMALPSVTAAAMAAVPPERGGMAAGAVSAFRQLGYALGIAILGSVFRVAVGHSLEHKVSNVSTTIDQLTSGHAAMAITEAHDGGVVRAAFATGLDAATTTASVIATVAAVTTIVLVRRRKPTSAVVVPPVVVPPVVVPVATPRS